jgi:transcriptional regulator GlxA family with amidase domain
VGGNPFGGGGNPYAAMGGQGVGDPFGDELSAHMSRMFAGMPQEGDDSQQAAQLQVRRPVAPRTLNTLLLGFWV